MESEIRLQTHSINLMHMMTGTLPQNAVDEIREAIDFLRYYSNQMIEIDQKDSLLEGPTGEINNLFLLKSALHIRALYNTQ